MYRFLRGNWGLFLLLLFSILPLLPLFHAGFFPIHDDTQIARVFEMGKSLGDGMIPVRWVQDLGYGYGYPIFTFYAPLAFYIGGIITLVGVSAFTATKIVMGIGILLSGIFMYYFARSVWGEVGGVFSALLYLYAPYHALDIYVRGDIAEFWAYAFIPLAFYGFWKIYQTQKIRFVLIGSLGFAGIVLSHNLTAVMVAPFLVLFGLVLVIVSKKKLSTAYYLLSPIALGAILSAFYWLPVPLEMQFTNVLSQVGGGADFHNHFVCLNQLWNSPWGYGGSAPGCVDGISFALGKIYILLFILGIILIPFVLKKSREKGILLIISVFAALLSVVLLLPISLPLWNSIHVLAFLQYPWRFLLVVFFFLSFISGAIFWTIAQTKGKNKTSIGSIVFVACIAVLVVVQGKYFAPQTFLAADSSAYTSIIALQWKTSRTTDEYMPKGFQKPKNPQSIPAQRFVLNKENGSIMSVAERIQEKSARILMKQSGKLFINLAYFPGWEATIDGKAAQILEEKAGMSISVPQGEHTIRVIYSDTPIEKIGDMVSVIGLSISILVIIQAYRKKTL